MVHVRVSDEYIHFELMYTTDHLFPVLPIKHLENQDGEPTTPHKLETGKKPSVTNLRILFFPCAVRKATAHIETKALTMRHQSQNCLWGILFGITQHQKGYLIYIPSTRKLFSSHDVIFDNFFIVSYHTRHVHIQRQLRRDQQYCKFHTLHHLISKLAIL